MSDDLTVWRAIDGVGDHPTDPTWGAAGSAVIRLTPADPDAYDGLGGGDRPGARDISNALVKQPGESQTPQAHSDFLWSWGQFLDHDLSLTPDAGVAAPIPVSAGDPEFDPMGTGTATIGFHRSVPMATGETEGVNDYANVITAYIDASMVYGSTPDQADAVRGEGPLLFVSEDGFMPKGDDGQYLGGDVRAGENVGLTSLHTLFVREHNRIVEALQERDPDLSDDALFVLARRVVEAEVQEITYDAFLPKILGEGAVGDYQGFDASVDPSIAIEFSTAAFRFGHTLLSPNLQRLAEDGTDAASALALRDAFFNPSALVDGGGIDTVLRGLADGTAQALDPYIVEDVRSFLFGPPGAGGFDLAALNIQRGRDHGLPTYNEMRAALGLDPKTSFADISSNPDIAARLEAAYGDVDLIDAWTGGLAEDAFGGGLVGELFHVIIRDQFIAVRAGDAHWHEANPLPEIAADLKLGTLAEIIMANTDIGDIQADVFLAYDRQGGGGGDDRLTGGGERDLLLGLDGDDRLFGLDGDDQLEGGRGDDRMHGGDGDDLALGDVGDDRMHGGDGDDSLFGEAGDDRIDGGDGDDWIEGGHGDDRLAGGDGDDGMLGGDGDDRIDGGAGHDELWGGAGDDRLVGGAGGDTLLGGDGDDVLFGNGGADVLNGGAGDDLLIGGRGADTFVFAGSFGDDRIRDFSAADSLVFEGFDQADALVSGGRSTIITFDGFGSVTLIGVHVDAIDLNDFSFS